jgi:hypothetical protein
VTIDLTRLSPGDAVAALRSYPRRFRTAFAPVEDENLEELAHAEGPDGGSAIDAAADTVRTWSILADALSQIRMADTPIVPRSSRSSTAAPTSWPTPPPPCQAISGPAAPRWRPAAR